MCAFAVATVEESNEVRTAMQNEWEGVALKKRVCVRGQYPAAGGGGAAAAAVQPRSSELPPLTGASVSQWTGLDWTYSATHRSVNTNTVDRGGGGGG